MVTFLDYDGTDPVSAAREAGEAITEARKEVESRGIKAFLFNAASPEEFDERASIREVSESLDEVSDLYLGSREGHAKLASVLRREFVAQRIQPFDNEQGFSYTDDNAGREQEFLDGDYSAPEGRELCPVCNGSGTASGEFEGDPCPACGGSGTAHDHASEADRDGFPNPNRVTTSGDDMVTGLQPPKEAQVLNDPIARSECPSCGTEVTADSLRDDASKREAATTGMCQNCQDAYFGAEQKTASTEPTKTAGNQYEHDTKCEDCGCDYDEHWDEDDDVSMFEEDASGCMACRGCDGFKADDDDSEPNDDDDYSDKTASIETAQTVELNRETAIEEFPVEVEEVEVDHTPRLPDWVTAAIENPIQATKKTAGADSFEVTSQGKNAEEAFSRAVEDAQYEHGHGGYSGTIAEKGSFRLFNPPKGVKPEVFIKGFHDFSDLVWDAESEDDGRSMALGKQVNYSQIGDSRPDVKECRGCGSKYKSPPKGARKPKDSDRYSNPPIWHNRAGSANFKEANPDFKTTFGGSGGTRAYDGPSPYKDELEATRAARGYGMGQGQQASERELELDKRHREHVDKAFKEAGGEERYSPFREGVCHNCGHKPLRQEKPVPMEHRNLYGAMHETYNDKWGDAVAIPLGKGQYHFMGYASS